MPCLEGLRHLGHGSVCATLASEGGASNGVGGDDAGETAVGVRAAGGGVEERERGAGGSIESVNWTVSLLKRS